MKRYMKRGQAWLLIAHRHTVVVTLQGGLYAVVIYSGADGTCVFDAVYRSLETAKTRGREELHVLTTGEWA